MAGLKASCKRNSKLLAQYALFPPTPTPDRSFHPLRGPRPSFPRRPLPRILTFAALASMRRPPFRVRGTPPSLQIKQNTRSFKMSALNSFQLFPLRASPSVRGKHVACPQRKGSGGRGVRAGGPRPSPFPSSPRLEGLGDAGIEPPTLGGTYYDLCDSEKGCALLL